ncbi:MAG: hypothetical protein WBP72_15550 [Rhodocyclaceae bacterium]
MDLLKLCGEPLYFEEPLGEEPEGLIKEASLRYAEGTAEPLLLRAYFLAPTHLSVLVSLYRFYYYQHRLRDAQIVADRALAVAAQRLGFPDDWRELSLRHLGEGVPLNMGLVRFYLMTLKAAGYLALRCGEVEPGLAMLEKLTEMDAGDRLGSHVLLDVARRAQATARGGAPYPD